MSTEKKPELDATNENVVMEVNCLLDAVPDFSKLAQDTSLAFWQRLDECDEDETIYAQQSRDFYALLTFLVGLGRIQDGKIN